MVKLFIISILFSTVCFGQKDSTNTDSLDLKVISMRDLEIYLKRIDLISQKQFDISEVKKYQQILKVIQSVYTEADKKRRK